MKIIEKHHPEARRLFLFKICYSILISLVLIFLLYRQVFESDDYESKERKQAQRRIIRPGARGDVLDRNGNLLIGNKANFDAVLHLEQLKDEIWQRKVALRKLAYQLRNELSNHPSLSVEALAQKCYQVDFVRRRGIRINGTKDGHEQKLRAQAFADNRRLDVENQSNGDWSFLVPMDTDPDKALRISVLNAELDVWVAGLFTLPLKVGQNGYFEALSGQSDQSGSIFSRIFPNLGAAGQSYPFSTSGFSLDWESRYSVVEKYLGMVEEITGRDTTLSMEAVQKHWKRRLIMPMELVGDLSPQEYASLVENLPADSPIQVQAKSVRHYPMKSLASHVLGYVGSGYEANASNLSGSDLATFEIEGRTGKAGIEKNFDRQLRGVDGGDIWRVNPMGYRFERIEKKPSEKGEMIRLSLDQDLQRIAETSLIRMVTKVADNRILPDPDWLRTIERRTRKALQGNLETEVSAELLISAFVDAPFPLNGKQASTVAGFKGTEQDASRLLRRLYAEGVLSKRDLKKEEYLLAPPMLPPAAAVLLDLESEEVLVLASIPNYNLQELSPFISQSTYDEIQRREAWLPRACHPGYAPASPFKLVTALAGIRNSVVAPEEKFLCEGIYKGMECHVFPGRHGELDLREAISQSCNVYFFRCAERIGYEKLIEEAKGLGFTENPSLELPKLRDSPIVPDPDWKKKTLGVKWTLEDTFNISIGQGGLRQSPLQMACFAAMLAKKQSSFRPSLLKESRGNNHLSRPAMEVNATGYQAIIDGMRDATTRGTARRCNIEGISIAGKTGTGQWRNRNMELNLAWFIGFAPVESPKVAVAVLVEGVIPQDEIQGGLTATPVARDLLAAYFAKLKDKPSSQNKQ